MRKYEVVFIVHPDLEESAFNDVIDRAKGWITQADGNVSNVDVWGKRKLAYPIRKQAEGQFVLLKTEMDPSFCHELERNLRLTEPVMRYLITAVD
ncbi:MAG TPA: 30S ribosomal protein S6 [Anaerolineales bacterium]